MYYTYIYYNFVTSVTITNEYLQRVSQQFRNTFLKLLYSNNNNRLLTRTLFLT